jgi:4-diphosphocytidyl-2-C-methyl-D-erythritol kinase
MKIYKAYAKVNIFLKITGTRGSYHEIISRFMLVKNLYDELEFVKKDTKEFKIIGDFSCSTEQNTIYKAYKALLEYTNSKELEIFMQNYAVKVTKNIPAFAGLGGGSSDAATYLLMCNKKLNLGLSTKILANIGLKVGADLPFFIYGYSSANVSGIGEIVEKFDEELLNIETFTPKIEISTPKVYKIYRERFFSPISKDEAIKFKNSFSKDILNLLSINEANDLFAPALDEYKELSNYIKDGWFFSGSGSSFFRATHKRDFN